MVGAHCTAAATSPTFSDWRRARRAAAQRAEDQRERAVRRGQRQRIGIARTLALRPKLMVNPSYHRTTGFTMPEALLPAFRAAVRQL